MSFFHSLLYSGNGGSSGNSWRKGVKLAVNAGETMQFVTLPKDPDMKVDYGDVRFLINPSGTGKDKFFLPYELINTDSNNLYYKVTHPSYFTPAAEFSAIWDNGDAVSQSDPYKTAFNGGWITNHFDRGANFDVANVQSNYDKIISGPGNATQERHGNGACQHPDNEDHCFVIYASDEVAEHAGTPSVKTAMSISKNFGETWTEVTVLDANIGYRTTSTTSNSIPTVGQQRTFTVDTGLLWQPGDIIYLRNDLTHLFWATVVSYSGDQLVVQCTGNTGTGTFASWTILQKYGWTNVSCTCVKMPNGVVRLGVLTNRGNFTPGVTDNYRVFFMYNDLDSNGDLTSWSTPVQVGPNNVVYVGGNAFTMHNGYMVFGTHENNADPAQYYAACLITRDYGATFENVRACYGNGDVLLDETDFRQLKDPITGEWTNIIRATCRNESLTTFYRQYRYTITVGPVSSVVSDIRENDWVDAVQSRYTSHRMADDTIFYIGGDATGKMLYTRDECTTYKPVPINVLGTSAVAARRTYGVLLAKSNGKCIITWSSNRLSGGSDLFMNYFDWTLNNLYCDAAGTLTNGAGTHNRPQTLSPRGIKIGEFQEGYRTSSTTSISVPTGAGQQRTLTVGLNLNWVPGDTFTCANASTIHWQGTVISYNPATGEFIGEWTANSASSTQANWIINKLSNLLSNQAFLTFPKVISNGQVRPCRTKMRLKSYGTGLRTGGRWGFKKFENRATAVVTITNAGSPGDTIEIRFIDAGTYLGQFGAMGRLAYYVVQPGDNIAAVVNGLVASANAIGTAPIATSDATTLTMMAYFGNSTFINGLPLTVITTGTVAGNSGNFSGGAAIEGSAVLANRSEFDNPNNLVQIEQANDGYNAAMTITDGPNDYFIDWNSSALTMQNETTTRTKTSANLSGVPNWEGQIMFFLTTSNGAPEGLIDELTEMIVEPLNQTPPTLGSTISGNWAIRSDGKGVQ